jgi:hypothetical protein
MAVKTSRSVLTCLPRNVILMSWTLVAPMKPMDGTAAMLSRHVRAQDPTSESTNASRRCCADTAEMLPLFADVVCSAVRGDSPWFNVGSSCPSPLRRLLCSFPIKPLRPHHRHHPNPFPKELCRTSPHPLRHSRSRGLEDEKCKC